MVQLVFRDHNGQVQSEFVPRHKANQFVRWLNNNDIDVMVVDPERDPLQDPTV